MERQLSVQGCGAVLVQDSFTGQAGTTSRTQRRGRTIAPLMRSGGWWFLDVDSIETLCRVSAELTLTSRGRLTDRTPLRDFVHEACLPLETWRAKRKRRYLFDSAVLLPAMGLLVGPE
ncbi:hypothetical protein [Variovorax ginsengisoli]|uniref:Uncharacterized protein n=1 Tax=Variovorax ginsengisoli TaxID=363844 RepID=A0ABT8RYP4_9BURK|nr:hypothetical protein [Variovorax ginsengisoli]MDN8612622.1 hypothetical protein [Variovorax ginsengisoli]MDO1531792.1 hypothetical protein [Variovorax ginsengisoli]